MWILGSHKNVKANANTASSLELQTEHGIDILVEFASGATGNIHLDYFHRPPARSSEFIGEEGRIEFNYYSGVAKLFSKESDNAVNIYKTPATWERNDMFIAEIKSFFTSIEQNENPSPNCEDGLAAVDVAVKALTDAGIY